MGVRMDVGFRPCVGVVSSRCSPSSCATCCQPSRAIAAWSERIVGVALIAVGLSASAGARSCGRRGHAHGVVSHKHLHIQAGPAWLRRLGHVHASFCLACSTASPAARISSGASGAGLAVADRVAELRRGVRRRHRGGDDRSRGRRRHGHRRADRHASPSAPMMMTAATLAVTVAAVSLAGQGLTSAGPPRSLFLRPEPWPTGQGLLPILSAPGPFSARRASSSPAGRGWSPAGIRVQNRPPITTEKWTGVHGSVPEARVLALPSPEIPLYVRRPSDSSQGRRKLFRSASCGGRRERVPVSSTDQPVTSTRLPLLLAQLHLRAGDVDEPRGTFRRCRYLAPRGQARARLRHPQEILAIKRRRARARTCGGPGHHARTDRGGTQIPPAAGGPSGRA